jgi:diaminopimelate epimerase
VSREIRFIKMHGAGNDFVMIDSMEERLSLGSEGTAAVCDRHRGIGADGLILIESSADHDFTMRYYNSDGGEVEMCGNGARCAALFAHRKGIAPADMNFDTMAGPVHAVVHGGTVTIDIGGVVDLRMGIKLDDMSYELHYAVSGVPHAALIHESAKDVPRNEFIEMARNVRFHPLFGEKGTNVNLFTPLREDALYFRTYERGVEAETQACGTGAVAVSVIAARLGLVSSPVECETSGGDILIVEFDPVDSGACACRLTGPAVISFDGSFLLESYIGC